MRRLSITLLAACALALIACGDDETNVGTGGDAAETQAQTQTQATTAEQQSASGCEKVAAPKPKKAGGRKKPKMTIDRRKTYTAVLETNCGTVTIRLADDRAPKTVNSVVALARAGFYDGLTFHRIVPDFVAQGGDPQGTGLGGPGYKVVEAPPQDLQYTRGVVAMAKSGADRPGASGSQFFIVTGADAGLPPDYALLGRVEDSEEALERISQVPVVPQDPEDPTVDNRPVEPVVIEKVTIRES